MGSIPLHSPPSSCPPKADARLARGCHSAQASFHASSAPVLKTLKGERCSPSKQKVARSSQSTTVLAQKLRSCFWRAPPEYQSSTTQSSPWLPVTLWLRRLQFLSRAFHHAPANHQPAHGQRWLPGALVEPAQGKHAHKKPARIPPLTYPSPPNDPWSIPEGRALPRPHTQRAATSTEHVGITGAIERGNIKEQEHFTAREGKVPRESQGAGAGQGVQDPFKQNLLPHHLVPSTSCLHTQASLACGGEAELGCLGIIIKAAICLFGCISLDLTFSKCWCGTKGAEAGKEGEQRGDNKSTS